MKKQGRTPRRASDFRDNCIVRDQSGSALVTVIIAMAFIGILATVLLYMTLLNYQMKLNNLEAKDNFYSAETVFDEIRMGMEEDVSNALSSAYESVLENYETTTESEKESRMRYLFLSELQQTFHQTAITNYSLSKLFGYLDKTKENVVLETETTDASGNKVTYTIESDGSGGAIVKKDGSVITDGSVPVGVMSTYSDGIVLENVKATYTENGYVSVIETDLRITLPDMDFTESVLLPPLTSYSMLAKGGIEMSAESGATNIIRGSFYTEQLTIPDGVTLRFEEDANDYNSSRVIVAANGITLGEGSTLYMDRYGALWTQSIALSGSGTVTFEGGSVYVADDLTLSGDGNTVTMGAFDTDGKTYIGSYTGFGSGSVTGESSAILVNGKNTTLDLTQLASLTLAGNSYIGLSSRTTELGTDATSSSVNDSVTNIVMGQSVAVKSDQLAYLVPAEAIAVQLAERSEVTNPMTLARFNELRSSLTEGETLVSFDTACSALNGKKLSDYGLKDMGDIQTYYDRVNSTTTMVYLYVSFDSTNETSLQNANDYFEDYYNANKSTMEAYARLYGHDIKVGTGGSYTLHLQGSMVSYTSTQGGTTSALTEDSAETDATSTDYKSSLTNEQAEFEALCKKLIEDYNSLSDDEKKDSENAYTNLINTDAVEAYDAAVQADTSITDKSWNAAYFFGDEQAGAMVVKGDYTYEATGKTFDGIIIATGNVTVNQNFNGLIVSGGKITLGMGVTVSANRKAALQAMTAKRTANGADYQVTSFFVGGKGYVTGSGSGYSDNTVDVGDLIAYENWQKE